MRRSKYTKPISATEFRLERLDILKEAAGAARELELDANGYDIVLIAKFLAGDDLFESEDDE